ncbi:MAG TPA: 2-C-methyl-D-erythritol 4-phosphate cytidylyltransferase [Gammaproteobacteria bacterium]|nr:2-C-methyl-D-erythritol 4-phosphate cytidylyltransferase [Gammaproteobacteria bacterium]
MTQARVFAVVPAAGVGRRMGTEQPKQYLALAGRVLMEWTLDALLANNRIARVCVVLAPSDTTFDSLAISHDPRVARAPGGAERCDSVLAGLEYCVAHLDPSDWVLVHDAARPCLPLGDLDRLIERCLDDPVGGLLAMPARDTLKRDDGHGRVAATIDRHPVWHALTPQMFRLGALRSALLAARARGLVVTDEAQAMELAGHAPLLVEGSASNLKVTRPEDLRTAASILAQTSPSLAQRQESSVFAAPGTGSPPARG